MAGIAMMIAGAVANAIAFIGGNAIYHALDAQSAAEERKRHDLAIEKLQKQSAEWSQNRVRHIDYLNAQRQKYLKAIIDFKDFNQAILDFERRNPQPELHQFYKPNETQHNYEKAYIAASVVGSGVASVVVPKMF